MSGGTYDPTARMTFPPSLTPERRAELEAEKAKLEAEIASNPHPLTRHMLQSQLYTVTQDLRWGVDSRARRSQPTA
jgi:hypothetical protein